MIPLSKGSVSSLFKKQKINGKNSTEGEIIFVDDAMAKKLWSIYFIDAQGYKVAHKTLLQNNNSFILLEINGKFSGSKWTKHIKNRYLFVMYRVAQVDLEIEHCFAERIWAGIIAKPLKCMSFRYFRE